MKKKIMSWFGNLITRLLIKAKPELQAILHEKSEAAYRSSRYDFFRKKFNLHNSFRFNGKDIILYGEGEIIIGHNSYIGSYSTLNGYKGQKIQIGNNCSISHNVRMYTISAEVNQDFNTNNKLNKVGDIIIGNGVWIGANVFIVPGITIGDNAIIGANSVVTKDILENSVVGGIPAKFINKKKFV